MQGALCPWGLGLEFPIRYRNGMKRLIRHYLEMVIAMFAGMMAWMWLSAMLFGQGGAMGMHASEVIDAEQSLMSRSAASPRWTSR